MKRADCLLGHKSIYWAIAIYTPKRRTKHYTQTQSQSLSLSASQYLITDYESLSLILFIRVDRPIR